MGNRLSKIYTRTGDKGTTGLGDGSRIEKDSERMQAIGCVDELNSIIGVVLACEIPESIQKCLANIQHGLFDLGGELSIPAHVAINNEHIKYLEKKLDQLNADLPPLKEFILPGGTLAAAHCHHARTVCRRAERDLLSLSRSDEINPSSLMYLNRLSDFLFVAARTLARSNGGKEILWRHDRTKK